MCLFFPFPVSSHGQGFEWAGGGSRSINNCSRHAKPRAPCEQWRHHRRPPLFESQAALRARAASKARASSESTGRTSRTDAHCKPCARRGSSRPEPGGGPSMSAAALPPTLPFAFPRRVSSWVRPRLRSQILKCTQAARGPADPRAVNVERHSKIAWPPGRDVPEVRGQSPKSAASCASKIALR